VTDDRQTTDHATEKWVAIGEVACARAILPNKEGHNAHRHLKPSPNLNYRLPENQSQKHFILFCFFKA